MFWIAQDNANNTALATTGAINTARKTTQDSAFAKTLDTVNAGNKVASNATTGLSAATSGAASAAQASANVAANAATQNQATGAMFTGLGKTMAKLATPSV